MLFVEKTILVSTCDPLRYKMGNSILIISICMVKAIIIKRG